MSPVTITTSASKTLTQRADRAILIFTMLYIAVSDSTDKQEFDSCYEELYDHLSELSTKRGSPGNGNEMPPAITHFDASPHHTFSEDRKDENGEVTERLITMTRDIEAEFGDLQELAPLVDHISDNQFVKFECIKWGLTDGEREKLENKARELAMEQSVARARFLAAGLGKEKVKIIEVVDHAVDQKEFAVGDRSCKPLKIQVGVRVTVEYVTE
ncbi:hypothetical protein BJY04DRAFT_216445 [Aspergillus karnatakaensis]|uniref:uncharacterized protein n=1 Tax=Aspergillus karnatakaensis TaxID=1810916 RepID=UPI003CCDD6E1